MLDFTLGMSCADLKDRLFFFLLIGIGSPQSDPYFTLFYISCHAGDMQYVYYVDTRMRVFSHH